MSDKENDILVERDAIALIKNLPIAKRSSDINLVRNSNSVNNLLVNNSTNNSVSINVQGGSGIQFGNTFHLNYAPQSSNYQPQLTASQPEEEAKVYRKTRSVAELTKSNEYLKEDYLDIFSRNFGDRYKEVFILLEIDTLFADRMHVDHFQHGSGEVVYQVLLQYFQENKDKATVGWFATFLWTNNFRKTVYKVAQKFKEHRPIENGNFEAATQSEIEESYL